MKHLAYALICLAVVPLSDAQVFSPNSGGANKSSSGNSSSPASSSGQTQEDEGNGNMLGNVLPFFDPSSETVLYEGQLWNINDNRLFNARFEKYLNTPAATSEEDLAYQKVIRDIREALSPHNKRRGGRTNLNLAVALLETAASYPQDDRMCDSLANAVYRVWLARKEVENLERANETLRRSRKDLVRNAEIVNEGRATSKPPRSQGQNNQNNNQQQEEDTGLGKLSELGELGTRYAEIQTKIAANEGKIAISEAESKLEFQALLVQFFAQRRFEHVIIAARIYTEFFADGAGRLEMEEGSDAEKMFKQTAGFEPTVTTLDTLATEAVRDVEESVDAFELLIEKEELASASKRLMEAFAVGEHLPAIQTIALEKKQQILRFVRNYNQLLSALSVKDYGRAEERVEALREMSVNDFDDAKPSQAINTAKITSSMHIQTAVNEGLSGNQQKFQDHITKATEIWPNNPDLKTAFNQMSQQGNVMIQTVNDLDRLIATRSYRQIYNDQGRYMAAVINDAERQAQLKEIIENITKIDIAIQQAEKLAQVGNHWGAWETVEEVFTEFPDDPPLSRIRSDLATQVSDFVSALKKAENLEDRQQYGSSLAWFLKSRQMYPASTFAQEGIDRLVSEILPDENTASLTSEENF